MAKVRVHELAKELNINSKDIINFLSEKNIEVKNHNKKGVSFIITKNVQNI